MKNALVFFGVLAVMLVAPARAGVVTLTLSDVADPLDPGRTIVQVVGEGLIDFGPGSSLFFPAGKGPSATAIEDFGGRYRAINAMSSSRFSPVAEVTSFGPGSLVGPSFPGFAFIQTTQGAPFGYFRYADDGLYLFTGPGNLPAGNPLQMSVGFTWQLPSFATVDELGTVFGDIFVQTVNGEERNRMTLVDGRLGAAGSEVPLPAAFPLFAAGLGLAALRRRFGK